MGVGAGQVGFTTSVRLVGRVAHFNLLCDAHIWLRGQFSLILSFCQDLTFTCNHLLCSRMRSYLGPCLSEKFTGSPAWSPKFIKKRTCCLLQTAICRKCTMKLMISFLIFMKLGCIQTFQEAWAAVGTGTWFYHEHYSSSPHQSADVMSVQLWFVLLFSTEAVDVK